mgnify:CR=1 FL=1
MYVDIHTHQASDNQSVIKIVDDFSERVLKTWGIHPWDIRHFDWSKAEWRDLLYKKALDDGGFLDSTPFHSVPLEMTAAIGEVGLDKVHKETFEEQKGVFAGMIRLSETYRKPMIIHCVRAYSEIIEMRKKTKATMPWVIHGFNSSVETMRQLLRYNIYISLGEILYRNENQAVKLLKNIPYDRLFLETDVSGRDIRDVYIKASTLTGCEVGFLCRQIFDNFNKIFTF